MGLSGISPLSVLLVFLIIIGLFGTNKLKSVGADLGTAIKQFRDALSSDDKNKPSS